MIDNDLPNKTVSHSLNCYVATSNPLVPPGSPWFRWVPVGSLSPGLFVLLVPGIEGLLSISLVLKDAQQVAIAEGINGLPWGETEKPSFHLLFVCLVYQKNSKHHTMSNYCLYSNRGPLYHPFMIIYGKLGNGLLSNYYCFIHSRVILHYLSFIPKITNYISI